MSHYKKAFLFDLNGTMIHDMDYHIRAWCSVFEKAGVPITFEKMKHECYGKNLELIERMFPGKFTNRQKEAMSAEKEAIYQREYRPQLQLLPGLYEFLLRAHEAGIPLGIASAAVQSSVDFVVDNLHIRHLFSGLITANDVS